MKTRWSNVGRKPHYTNDNKNIVMDGLLPLGKMTVFYIPSEKLDDPLYYGDKTARVAIHEFLMAHYRAYTHTPTPVKGYWMNEQGSLVHDVMERFEVSFTREADFRRLIKFLVTVCRKLDEDTIYVTRGDRSYLASR